MSGTDSPLDLLQAIAFAAAGASAFLAFLTYRHNVEKAEQDRRYAALSAMRQRSLAACEHLSLDPKKRGAWERLSLATSGFRERGSFPGDDQPAQGKGSIRSEFDLLMNYMEVICMVGYVGLYDSYVVKLYFENYVRTIHPLFFSDVPIVSSLWKSRNYSYLAWFSKAHYADLKWPDSWQDLPPPD